MRVHAQAVWQRPRMPDPWHPDREEGTRGPRASGGTLAWEGVRRTGTVREGLVWSPAFPKAATVVAL